MVFVASHRLMVALLHLERAGPFHLDVYDSGLALLPTAGLLNAACLAYGLDQVPGDYRLIDLDTGQWMPTPELARDLVGRRVAAVHRAAEAAFTSPDPAMIAAYILLHLQDDDDDDDDEGDAQPSDRELLVATLQERIQRAAQQRDTWAVLDPAAMAEAEELTRDRSEVHTLGMLHWFRYLSLPAGEDEADLLTALELFDAIREVAAEYIPEPARAMLAERQPGIEPPEAHVLSNQAMALLSTDDVNAAVVERALLLVRRAIELTGEADPDRPGMLINLNRVLVARFEHSGRRADLDEAVEAARGGIGLVDPADPDRALLLSNLGVALGTRFDRYGDLADLDGAVAAGRAAVGAAAAEHPDRPMYLFNLGLSHTTRFHHVGGTADLDRAVELGGQAIDAVRPDSPERNRYQYHLGLALRARFDRFGDPADLDRAIEVGRAAVRGGPEGRPPVPAYLYGLSLSLRVRFEHSGDLADLDRAIEIGRRAVDPAGGSGRAPAMLGNLASALSCRYGVHHRIADLDEAIDLHRRAVSNTPADHPDRGHRLSHLGNTLLTRYGHAPGINDLREAIDAGREAVAVTPAEHPKLPILCSNLAQALRTRFDLVGAQDDLDEAIAASRRAVLEAPADDAHQAAFLMNLAGHLLARHDRSGTADDEATALLERAAQLRSAPPAIRCDAAERWGNLAAERADWGGADRAFRLAVELLATLAHRRISQESRRRHLARFGHLGRYAAAVALRAGASPAEALALLEQGRGVLLAQALQIRGDARVLHERHPGLAERFEWLRGRLDLDDDGPEPADGGAWASDRADERRRVTAEWDRLLADVRGHAGFERFLRPPDVDMIALAGGAGPTVVVNATRYGCDAFIVTVGGVDRLALAELTVEDAVERGNELLAAATSNDWGANDTVRAVLAWLWDTIAEPVLRRIGLIGAPAAGEPWPRLWWMPTGVLSVMPLHAAGRYGGGDGGDDATVLDRTISSYTPTLHALHHSRGRPAPAPARPLIVAMARTAGQRELPAAPQEAALVAAHLSAPTPPLVDADASCASVRMALQSSTWAHFACHAVTDPHDPAASRLLLHDGALAVPDVSRLHLQDAGLAYLSACGTAHGGIRMLDEALHISSAFQLAGYTHVIGSLWPIADDVSRDLADRTYTELARTSPASALHRAVQHTRRRFPDNPLLWAAHVHSGP
jgi:tetratricopeptide (TPR) repeat protein